jgi:hypothetical protein
MLGWIYAQSIMTRVGSSPSAKTPPVGKITLVSSSLHVETLHKRTLLYCIINLSALNYIESGPEAKTGPWILSDKML